MVALCKEEFIQKFILAALKGGESPDNYVHLVKMANKAYFEVYKVCREY